MKKKILVAFMYAAILLFSAAAMCQENKDWNFELAPFYLWAIGTDYTSGDGTDRFIYDAVVHGPVMGLDIRW